MSSADLWLPRRPDASALRAAVARALRVAESEVTLHPDTRGAVGVMLLDADAPFRCHVSVGMADGADDLTDADLGIELARVTGMDVLCSTHRFDDPADHDGVIVHPDGSATFFWDDDETNFRLDGPAAPATAAE